MMKSAEQTWYMGEVGSQNVTLSYVSIKQNIIVIEKVKRE